MIKAKLQREKEVRCVHLLCAFSWGPLELCIYFTGVKRPARFHLMEVIFELRWI